jgi:hypothetical protein
MATLAPIYDAPASAAHGACAPSDARRRFASCPAERHRWSLIWVATVSPANTTPALPSCTAWTSNRVPRSFFAPPASELHNVRVSLDALWGNQVVRELCERVAEVDTLEERARILEKLLARNWFAPGPPPAVTFASKPSRGKRHSHGRLAGAHRGGRRSQSRAFYQPRSGGSRPGAQAVHQCLSPPSDPALHPHTVHAAAGALGAACAGAQLPRSGAPQQRVPHVRRRLSQRLSARPQCAESLHAIVGLNSPPQTATVVCPFFQDKRS